MNTLSFQKTIRHCRYNLVTHQSILFGVPPDDFDRVNYYPNNFINGYTAGKYFITWFFPLHEVQVYDGLRCNLISRVRVKSAFLPETVEPLLRSEEGNPDMQEEANYNMQTPFYVRMFSNEQGNLHYRFVKHAVPLRYADGRMRHFHDKPFSVMVLDEHLKLIDEVSFPGKQHDFFQSFAVGNRLFISLNNPLNQLASDDYMQFAVYEIR